MSNNKKEYKPSIGFWPAKSGKGYTVSVNDKVAEIVNTIGEGGLLLLQEVESDNEKAPSFRLTVFTKEECDAFRAKPAGTAEKF